MQDAGSMNTLDKYFQASIASIAASSEQGILIR